MNKFLKKGTTTALAGIIMISGMSTTAFASEITQNDMTRNAIEKITIEALNENITKETAEQIVEELLKADYDYSDLDEQERSVVSNGVKTVLKFIKKNKSKINDILKEYGVKATFGKGAVQLIDDILSGVYEVSDSIDEAIYTVVDFVIPNVDEDIKQIISNCIRLISPV